MKKYKKRSILLVAVSLAIIIVVLVFFQFTNIGYCMTIRFRSFTELEHNIFINNSYSFVSSNENNEPVTRDEIPAIVNEARNRVADFFGGELLSDPVIIISDNSRTYRVTGEQNTYTGTLLRVYSFITLSHRFLSVDEVAHEITHAELSYRLLSGKIFRFGTDSYVPVWFSEGLASINDYRKVFNRETWEIRTDNGKNIDINVTALISADFYGNHHALIIQEYFLFARHEVLSWVDKNGADGLLRLIDGVRIGEDFNELYNSE